MTKIEAYERATLLEIGENPNGSRQDVVYKAMDIYGAVLAKEFASFMFENYKYLESKFGDSWYKKEDGKLPLNCTVTYTMKECFDDFLNYIKQK